MILVDTNIVMEALQNAASSAAVALRHALASGAGINPIIMAELAGGLHDPHDVAAVVPPELERLDLPWTAAPIAAQAFIRYRGEHAGTKTLPLPDFFIGAHAEAEKLRLLTRDTGRYSKYFPTIDVILP